MSNSLTDVSSIDTANVIKAQQAYRDLNAWSTSQSSPRPGSLDVGMDAVGRFYRYGRISTMAPILGLLLWLKGRPFSLEHFFPFEPMYRRFDIPRRLIWKCGRQVSKSTSLAAQGVIQSAIKPYFNTLFVTPLFEQIRRFSSNYVRPLIKDSPLRQALIGESSAQGAQNVLQRTMANGSIMHFTFAFIDAERTRGVSCDKICYDEIQDINPDHIHVIEHCLKASQYKLQQMSGTPKTSDNVIQIKWEESSRAEWCIPCGCGYWNICTVHHDLMNMIQKDGLVCAKCGSFVNPRTGAWVHSSEDQNVIRDFAGYHVPQPIMPMHLPPHCGGIQDENNSSFDAWNDIWKAKNSPNQSKFYNECLGESADTSSTLVTKPELIAVSQLPWPNKLNEALQHVQEYEYRVMGIDWGGGAGGIVRRVRGILKVEGGSASFTVVTIIGFRPGSIMPEVLYSERFDSNMQPHAEVSRVLHLFGQFQCWRVGHDFGGAGNLRESMMLQAGFPPDRIFPLMYMPAVGGKHICAHIPASANNPRTYYQLDKARSLSMLCQLIKLHAARNPPTAVFPRWDESLNAINLPEDFLALVEDKRDRPGGADILLITRHPSKADDFCHALNFGCISHWHSRQAYPDLAQLYQVGLTEQQQQALYPAGEQLDWNS